jgi:imidazolonepropionase-like amidohydrolase
VPSIARGWKLNPPTGGLVRIAGPFLTAIGGYPSDRVWAPPGSVRELAGPEDGMRAVDEAVAQGYDIVKLVLHSGGPLLDDPTLHEVVRAAHQHGLPVGVHAEGRHQARRAFEAGADVLVHAPWTEALADDLLSNMASSMRWISTFAIHSDSQFRQALDNARRFLRFGGRLDYGTDMGNGPGPAGPRTAEISALGAAGLSGNALLTSLTGPFDDHLQLDRAVYAPVPLPDSATDVAAWMHQAQRLTHVISEAVIA